MNLDDITARIIQKWTGALAVIYGVENVEEPDATHLLLYYSKAQDPWFQKGEERTLLSISGTRPYKIIPHQMPFDTPTDMTVTTNWEKNR